MQKSKNNPDKWQKLESIEQCPPFKLAFCVQPEQNLFWNAVSLKVPLKLIRIHVTGSYTVIYSIYML